MTLGQAVWMQGMQLGFVLLVSPLIKGILNRWKEFVQGKRGPSIFQVYRDLRKLFHKETVIPEDAGLLYRVAPYVYFAAPLIVTMLIPVLTSYPLFMAFAGDMMAGGFILGLGTYALLVGATAGASPYGGIGSTRARFVSMCVEPALILILFAVSFSAHATIPYIVNGVMQHLGWSPVHLLLMAAFFAVLLAETGRIPVDNPSSHREFSMIDHNRAYDYSGPHLALIEWGGCMKFVVLGVILLNVITSPWGLANGHSALALLAGAALVFVKFLALLAMVVWVESSIGKLRLLRIAEYMAAAAAVALTAVILAVAGV
ncbi:respiratory chain complex I subunit 1 family protein [Alicyclobacillus shizuokensis]|uniref:respiratory chain complex I subunit 1 family protein n=1 Tax=Alicyclobacillus shizuokensis TaxID=392014 RepID=UPI00082CEC3E|nr:NADH-quinone oxidoreductase subunit H [Alicyclobacillus shizuokensis]